MISFGHEPEWELRELLDDGTWLVTLGSGEIPPTRAPVSSCRMLRPLSLSTFKAMVAALQSLP